MKTDEDVTDLCDDVANHVYNCRLCQRRLQFDPVEKALLKSHSVKNEVLEFTAFLATGCFIIVILSLVVQLRKADSV